MKLYTIEFTMATQAQLFDFMTENTININSFEDSLILVRYYG